MSGRYISTFHPAAFSGLTEYRHGSAKPVTLAGAKRRPVLPAGKRERVLEDIVELLKAWKLSPFEHEASAIHGLRQALCIDGVRWQRANAEAEDVVATALRRIGASRPSWNEGQPGHTESPDRCAGCHRPIEDNQRVDGRRFCSLECARATHSRIESANESRGGAVKRAAYRMIHRSAQPQVLCQWCVTPFHPGEASARFCCLPCKAAASRTVRNIRCEVCDREFRPAKKWRRWCSPACRVKGMKIEAAERLPAEARPCAFCAALFHPQNDKAAYCGQTCRNLASRAAAYLRMGRLFRITPPAFDHVFRRTA